MHTEALSTHPLEYELLWACASHNPGEDAASLVRQLARHANWDYVTQSAQRHSLIPLVYRNLSGICSDIIPRDVLGRLRQAHLANAAHNLRVTGELLRILTLFENAGIEVVPFKGPVLADRLFGNVSLRQFGDLDILVRPQNVRRAKALLLADGYKPEFALSGKIEDEYIRSEHAFQFQREALGFVIELHWRFGSRNQVFPICSEDVWTRLDRRSFQGREILALSHEDLLLYLCVHGAKHGWDRLEWISCVFELVRRSDEFDWDAIVQCATRSGARRALHVGLLLASELGSLAVPPSLTDGMFADPEARKLADQARKRLFLQEPDHTKREVYRHEFYLRTRERALDRARILFYFSARVPHPLAKDWYLFKVPASMSFLYYLLRPMRLMREHGFRRLREMLRPNATF